MSSFADLEIRILEQQAEGYPVEITLNQEQQFERGFLQPQPWTPTADMAADGERLFAWLFADPALKSAWAEVRGQFSQRRIRLRIDADAPELHAVPWELLRDSSGPVAQDVAAMTATPFSRYLAGRWQPGTPIFKRPLKMLVVMANPSNLSERFNLQAIELDKEWELLQAATADLPVELVQLPQPCSLPALEAALKEGVHILHFIGHGSFSERTQKSVLFMADDNNETRLVDADEFAELISRLLGENDNQDDDRLRLVFLASCQTATRSPADAFRGVAPSLIGAGIPAVLAMQDLVPVDTARAFASTFYSNLLEHGQVDLASNEARSAVIAAGLPGAAIPVLFMRLRSGQLLGKRGRISSGKGDNFWPFLLDRIYLGECIPFIGPRFTDGLLPSHRTASLKLAEKYQYPMNDKENLARVALFISLHDRRALHEDYIRLMKSGLFTSLGLTPTKEDRQRFRRSSFSEMVTALDWAGNIQELQDTELHHLLAQLPLPFYVTTNFDNFLTEALKKQDLAAPPRRLQPRWEASADTTHYVINPPPSPEEPIVFHINGYDLDPDHMVLSEDDFFAHYLTIYQKQENLLPMSMLEALSRDSYLFLGYRPEDWEFRVLLQGLIGRIAQSGHSDRIHVGVQFEAENDADAAKSADYLERYMGKFNIDIYWGSVQQFVTELHTRWLEFEQEEEQDDDFF